MGILLDCELAEIYSKPSVMSCPAQAGHPVITALYRQTVITGSSAGACHQDARLRAVPMADDDKQRITSAPPAPAPRCRPERAAAHAAVREISAAHSPPRWQCSRRRRRY